MAEDKYDRMLENAIKNNDIKKVYKIIEKHNNLSGNFFDNGLFLAGLYNRPEIIGHLLTYRRNPTIALRGAVRKNNFRLVNQIIEIVDYFKKINPRNPMIINFNEPLIDAIVTGNIAIVDYLFELGADDLEEAVSALAAGVTQSNGIDDELSVVYMEILYMLLQMGANLEDIDPDWITMRGEIMDVWVEWLEEFKKYAFEKNIHKMFRSHDARSSNRTHSGIVERKYLPHDLLMDYF